ncbi:MAG: exodeoxyribonuclease VII large subunit [Peptococcaceae bacterium]|nr:exodeoxyribonuclease VII large subunit [Peptococcaceae bacterium]
MRILTIREVTQYIKELLDADPYLANVWVKGEVTNCHYHPSGHVYLTLKDNVSMLRTVIFRSKARRLNFRLADGMAVVAQGYVSLFEREGQYQLYAAYVEPEGVGVAHLNLEQLKAKLEREGLFDQTRKKALPRFPESIGIVTSPVGAAVKDILAVLGNRWPQARVYIAPVTVQGETAAYEIARGINILSHSGLVDVIIVGRGGGSPEELAAFNSEAVARAVYASKVPVVSAVGHEKDVTVTDLVADKRAATPSVAAEIATPNKMDVVNYVNILEGRLKRAMSAYVRGVKSELRSMARSSVLQRPADFIIARRREQLERLDDRLRRAMRSFWQQRAYRLSVLSGRLEALSPLATLARGYSICYSFRNEVVRSPDDVKPGEDIKIWLSEGGLHCKVTGQMRQSLKSILTNGRRRF